MANKRIRTDAPDTVKGVRARINQIERGSPASRPGSFDNLILDTLAGIAEAGKEGHRAPDDPVQVAREVLRYGAEVYADSGGAEMWVTWPEAEPDSGEVHNPKPSVSRSVGERD